MQPARLARLARPGPSQAAGRPGRVPQDRLSRSASCDLRASLRAPVTVPTVIFKFRLTASQGLENREVPAASPAARRRSRTVRVPGRVTRAAAGPPVRVTYLLLLASFSAEEAAARAKH
jgi:hypothetical protein